MDHLKHQVKASMEANQLKGAGREMILMFDEMHIQVSRLHLNFHAAESSMATFDSSPHLV